MKRGVTPFQITTISLAAFALAGCGSSFKNNSDSPTTSAQVQAQNAGVAAATATTITPDGKTLTIITLSPIQALRTATTHTAADTITLNLSVLSQSSDFSAVHLQELSKLTAKDGVYSTDSALGCSYILAAATPTQAASVGSLSGSCILSATVQLPDHDIPRAFLGATPLFADEIELTDVKAIFAALPHDSNLNALLQSYAARLAPNEQPVLMSDVAILIAALDSDAKRIDAIAALAPKVSDPANAAGTLTASLFTDAANYTRAVAIFSAYP